MKDLRELALTLSLAHLLFCFAKQDVKLMGYNYFYRIISISMHLRFITQQYTTVIIPNSDFYQAESLRKLCLLKVS